MTTIDKLHRRETINVLPYDTESREGIVSSDAKRNAMMVTWNLLKDFEFQSGDEMVVDVRILVERKEAIDMGRRFE